MYQFNYYTINSVIILLPLLDDEAICEILATAEKILVQMYNETGNREKTVHFYDILVKLAIRHGDSIIRPVINSIK